ncbi:MAG: VCBS repeat-containing protein [Roseivirga sp.]|nr:VCBS repeat-containing protein [Roseivirga sp.]
MKEVNPNKLGIVYSLVVLGFLPMSLTAQVSYTDVTDTHLKGGPVGNTMDGHSIDIDKDGDLDLILAMEFGPNKLLINDGKGVLTDESDQRFPRQNHDSEDIAIADFDGDGDADIVFVSEDDRVNEFYLNDGKGFFTAIEGNIPVTGTSNAVEAADLDNDGDWDLVIGNAGQNFVLINNGQGVFTDESQSRYDQNNFTTQDIELADVDLDGDLDILEANEAANRLMINNGMGYFTDASAKRLPVVNDQTREADFGDIDGDGDPDIFFANVDFGGFGDPQNRLLLNDGKGYFKEATDLLPKSAFRTVDADFTDLNRDGHLDLLVGNRFNGMEMIALINDGKLNFSDRTRQIFPEMNMYPFDFQVADFNGDGIPDIFVCGFRGPDKLLFGKK